MEITKIGHSCFKLKGKKITLVTDPFDPVMLGKKIKEINAQIITVSHQHKDHNYTKLVSGDPFIISGPGEYEISGCFVKGISTYHDNKNGQDRGKNIVFSIEMDGVHLAHLGDLGHKLSDEQVAGLDGVDILMVPVGGFYTIDSKVANEIVAQLEPKIIIPMHYLDKENNKDNFSKLAPIDNFISEIGKEVHKTDKFNVAKNTLPTELTVVVLE